MGKKLENNFINFINKKKGGKRRREAKTLKKNCVFFS